MKTIKERIGCLQRETTQKQQEHKLFTRQHKCKNFKCKSENSPLSINKFRKQIFQHIRRLGESVNT